MHCDILIRSYYKDLGWLAYALRSIRRHCHGFSKVIVVVPQSSRERLDWLRLNGDVTITCPNYRDDYLGQQVTKLMADTFSEADYICHIDSDCIFQRSTTPEDLLVGRRPAVLMAPYDSLDSHTPWKALTEQLLRREVPMEFMRTPPYTFPRWIYAAFRQHVSALHGTSLEKYVLRQPYRGFSEFNALGAYAYLYHHESFVWRDVGHIHDSPCRVFWSWGGIDSATRREIEDLLS
jgi:Family of unknown function (DUF6492)